MKTRKKLAITISCLVLTALVVVFAFYNQNQLSADIITADHSMDYSIDVKKNTDSEKEVWIWDKRPEFGTGWQTLELNDQRSHNMIRDIGVNVMRSNITWASIETAPGVYDEAKLENWGRWIDWAKRDGIDLEIVVSAPPAGVDYAHREESFQRFANLMGMLAKRFPSVHYWELFNEMDFSELFGKTDPNNIYGGVPMKERGKIYAGMLKLAYPAIKAANPDAYVLTGGFVETFDFPTGIYEAGGRDFFDVMAFHSYNLPLYESQASSANYELNFRGQGLRNIMNRFGDQGKPIWVTETGVDAGRTQKLWGYPRTWAMPTDTSQDPPECNWNSLPKGSDGKLLYDGDGFDYVHCKQWKSVVEGMKRDRIYSKILAYQFRAPTEMRCTDYQTTDGENDCPGAVLDMTDSNKAHIDNYGFGIIRISNFYTNPLVPRPTYNWLKSAQVNKEINQEPSFTSDVTLTGFGEGFVPENYEYQKIGGGVIVKNVSIGIFLPTKIILIKEKAQTEVNEEVKKATIQSVSTASTPTELTITKKANKENVKKGGHLVPEFANPYQIQVVCPISKLLFLSQYSF